MIWLNLVRERLKIFTGNMKPYQTGFFHLQTGNLDNWTVIEREYLTEKDGKMQWVTELNFYLGDLQSKEIDLKVDWRFCEVKDKRKQAIILGVCKTSFPIKYPLLLTNGTVIRNDGERGLRKIGRQRDN